LTERATTETGWRSAWSGVKDATLHSPILPEPEGRGPRLGPRPGLES